MKELFITIIFAIAFWLSAKFIYIVVEMKHNQK